jgi:hypothetical protein
MGIKLKKSYKSKFYMVNPQKEVVICLCLILKYKYAKKLDNSVSEKKIRLFLNRYREPLSDKIKPF